jgi:hypothetical protein
MPIQSAVSVALSYRRETGTIGTLAPNDATAKSVPYVSHSLNLSKSAIASEEIRPDYQMATMRHGNRAVGGDLQLQLQTGTYNELMASALRRDFTAVTALTSLTVTAAVVAPHFVRSAGSWITDGLAVGMCVRFSGFTSTGVPNNAKNFTITALTATQMTVAEAVVARTGDTAVGLTVPGRVTFMPITGHTQTSYTVEEWNPDVPRSNRFVGLRVNTMAMDLPPNARATLTFGMIGRDRQVNAARYFTSAVVPAAAPMQVGHNGVLVVGGVVQGIVTALQINVTNSMEVGAVVGANLTPDVFHGPMRVTGSVTVYFDTATIDDVFDQETEISLIARVTDDLTAASGFVQICLPRIKLAGGSYSTSNQSRLQSFDFTALLSPTTGGNLATTMLLQDSSLP